jgi:hypothetical protein
MPARASLLFCCFCPRRQNSFKLHRQVLEKNMTRTRTLIETIDKTIRHLKGNDLFNGGFNRNGATIDCKVSGKDTGGALCVLEVNNSGWPSSLHYWGA